MYICLGGAQKRGNGVFLMAWLALYVRIICLALIRAVMIHAFSWLFFPAFSILVVVVFMEGILLRRNLCIFFRVW